MLPARQWINQARGEGLERAKSFLGLNLQIPRDMVLLLVEEHLSRHILESITEIGKFDRQVGMGIAFQLNIEDAVGISRQIEKLTEKGEEMLRTILLIPSFSIHFRKCSCKYAKRTIGD